MSPQLQAFCLSALCGVGVLLLWDIMHGLRRVFFHGVFSNAVLDILWWFLSVTAFLWCIWETVSMRLRFFEGFAMILGAVVYHFTLSGCIRSIFCRIFEIFLKIFQFILKILLTPAQFLDKILIRRKSGRKKGV